MGPRSPHTAGSQVRDGGAAVVSHTNSKGQTESRRWWQWPFKPPRSSARGRRRQEGPCPCHHPSRPQTDTGGGCRRRPAGLTLETGVCANGRSVQTPGGHPPVHVHRRPPFHGPAQPVGPAGVPGRGHSRVTRSSRHPRPALRFPPSVGSKDGRGEERTNLSSPAPSLPPRRMFPPATRLAQSHSLLLGPCDT